MGNRLQRLTVSRARLHSLSRACARAHLPHPTLAREGTEESEDKSDEARAWVPVFGLSHSAVPLLTSSGTFSTASSSVCTPDPGLWTLSDRYRRKAFPPLHLHRGQGQSLSEFRLQISLGARTWAYPWKRPNMWRVMLFKDTPAASCSSTKGSISSTTCCRVLLKPCGSL